jgi:translation initiation factor 2B subunit (eIF-2B alpha/beta/delta family)
MSFREDIEEIIQDNKSGSLSILDKLVHVLQRNIKPEECHLNEIISQLNYLYSKFPFFMVLFHFINAFFLRIEKILERKYLSDRSCEELLSFIEKYQDSYSFAYQKAARNFLKHFAVPKAKIITLSNSSSVQALLREWGRKYPGTEVFQSISGPANEGKVQAQILADQGIRVHLFHDTAMAHFFPTIDCVVLGADCIFPDVFINKSASFQLALMAKYFNKPVYVIADSRKFIVKDNLLIHISEILHFEKPQASDELWPEAPDNINVQNFYFDCIPNSLVSAFVLEHAVLHPEHLKKHISNAQISRFFDFSLSF